LTFYILFIKKLILEKCVRQKTRLLSIHSMLLPLSAAERLKISAAKIGGFNVRRNGFLSAPYIALK